MTDRPTLSREDAQRIVRHFSMTGKERRNRTSTFQIADESGKSLSQGLSHIDMAELEAMPGVLRRRLLQSGLVYIISNYTTYPELGGSICGQARYTRPMEGGGSSDMAATYPAYRVPEQFPEDPANHDVMACASSDSSLFIDLKAIEALVTPAAQRRPAAKAAR